MGGTTWISMSGTACSGMGGTTSISMSGTTCSGMGGTITSVWVAQHGSAYPPSSNLQLSFLICTTNRC